MRIKNAFTRETKQGSRPLSGKSKWGKYEILRYGNKHDPDALQAVHALHNALNLKTSPPNSTFADQVFAEYRDEFWNFIADNYRKSWAKHDGTFFRKLADAMEVHQRVNDPAWTCAAGEIFSRQERGLPMPTITELHAHLSECEIATTRKTVERIFDYFEIKPAAAKRGPRPGTRQKSVHRQKKAVRRAS